MLFINALSQVDKRLVTALRTIGDEASVGALCVNLTTNDTLWNYHSRQLLVPASVLKLVTTSTALEILSPKYQFHTRFCYSGDISDSTLNGNIIVFGGGDPTLGSSYFPGNSPDVVCSKVLAAIKAKGIKHIKGKILIDDTYFDNSGLPSARLWEDMGNYYGAAPKGLTYRDNTLAVYLSSPSTAGGKCKVVETIPQLPDITFDCEVYASDSSRDSAYVYGVDGLNQWRIQGSIPVNQSRFLVKAALANPEYVFGNDLKNAFKKAGIQVDGGVEIENIGSQVVVGELLFVDSPPLQDIITTINVNSNNLFADHLFLTLGKSKNNHSGWDAGGLVVRDFWKKKLSTREAFVFKDGSGLSPNNTISAAALIDVLTAESKSPYFSNFYASLAIGGEKGTLKNLWKEPEVKGRIHGKSGSMFGVVSYAGYFYNSQNELCAFAIIVNHALPSAKFVRGAIERLVSASVLQKMTEY